ncbi:Gfo/Idh/MocA family protein [Tessaracoccus sp. Z1128]
MTVRFGILGAAGITPSALIAPARANDDVRLTAVAARNRGRAEEFAAEHGVEQVLESYEALLASPDVDAVYIPLPNSAHAEWTVRAAQAGKHVLVEKPYASNAEEARRVVEAVSGLPVVVMEAFHYRHHPLIHRAEEILAAGTIGPVLSASAVFDVQVADRSNIRYNWELAGGATMDLGCYSIHLLRTLLKAEPTVVSAEARRFAGGQIDEALTAQLEFPGGITAVASSSLFEDVEKQSARLVGTLGTLEIEGFVKPHGGNSLTVTVDGQSTTETVAPDVTSYGEQLAAFVAAVEHGGPVVIDAADSIATMEVIDACYRAAGLEPRHAVAWAGVH